MRGLRPPADQRRPDRLEVIRSAAFRTQFVEPICEAARLGGPVRLAAQFAEREAELLLDQGALRTTLLEDTLKLAPMMRQRGLKSLLFTYSPQMADELIDTLTRLAEGQLLLTQSGVELFTSESTQTPVHFVPGYNRNPIAIEDWQQLLATATTEEAPGLVRMFNNQVDKNIPPERVDSLYLPPLLACTRTFYDSGSGITAAKAIWLAVIAGYKTIERREQLFGLAIELLPQDSSTAQELLIALYRDRWLTGRYLIERVAEFCFSASETELGLALLRMILNHLPLTRADLFFLEKEVTDIASTLCGISQRTVSEKIDIGTAFAIYLLLLESAISEETKLIVLNKVFKAYKLNRQAASQVRALHDLDPEHSPYAAALTAYILLLETNDQARRFIEHSPFKEHILLADCRISLARRARQYKQALSLCDAALAELALASYTQKKYLMTSVAASKLFCLWFSRSDTEECNRNILAELQGLVSYFDRLGMTLPPGALLIEAYLLEVQGKITEAKEVARQLAVQFPRNHKVRDFLDKYPDS